MKKILLCAILSTLSSTVFAASLQDQLSAVAEAEQQGKNEAKKEHDEWVAQRNREIQQEKQRRANAQAAANKKAAAAAAERQARQDKLDAEASKDKKRDQGYEDELRSLEIQKQNWLWQGKKRELNARTNSSIKSSNVQLRIPTLCSRKLMQIETCPRAVAIYSKA